MNSLFRKENTILLADDEPYNLVFVLDFLEAQGFRVVVADNVDKALLRLQENRFRAIIADLSIPYLSPQVQPTGLDQAYQSYPGLIVADYARNHGHTGRQVIVYSVHDDAHVREITDSLGATYLLKGRPRQFKDEINDVLSFDPLSSSKP